MAVSLYYLSCFVWDSALDSSDLLLSYPAISLASHITIILIYNLFYTYNTIPHSILRADGGGTNSSEVYFNFDKQGFVGEMNGITKFMTALAVLQASQSLRFKGLFLFFYTVRVLFHVEWCIRLLALMLFNHTL